MSTFLNRPLTRREQRLRNDKRCIACGQKVEVAKHREKNEQGKLVITKEVWNFECDDCRKQRTQTWLGTKDYGAARASVGREYRKRMGYSDKDGGS